MKFVFVRRILSVTALVLGLSVSTQAAASNFPSFTIDFDQSSIDVTTSTCIANCGITVAFTETGATSIQFDHNWQRVALNDIIRWDFANPTALSAGLYDIAMNLVFTSPDYQQSTTRGGGLLATFYGVVSAGILAWDSVAQTVNFDQGSSLLVVLDGGFNFGFGAGLKTGMSIISRDLVALDAPSPAPIPPVLPVMLLALGGMLYMGRKRNSNPAAA